MSDTFRHITSYGSTRLTDNLGNGIAQYLNQCYLNIGAYTNITIPTSGAYGGAFHRLRPVNDPYYTNGKVWEAARSNWVFENDLKYGIVPISISGVYINGVFNPTTGIANAHQIHYPYGRIIFTSGISTNSNVTCEYSFKNVNVYTNDVPWFREFMTESLRVDSGQFLQQSSGIWHTAAQNRVQLPAIIVQPISSVRLEGIELGGSNKRYQDVILHVFSEHPWEKNSIVDDMINQKDGGFWLYDRDEVNRSGVYPLKNNGQINSNGLPYTRLISDPNFQYRNCFIKDVVSREFVKFGGLYYAAVTWTIEIYI